MNWLQSLSTAHNCDWAGGLPWRRAPLRVLLISDRLHHCRQPANPHEHVHDQEHDGQEEQAKVFSSVVLILHQEKGFHWSQEPAKLGFPTENADPLGNYAHPENAERSRIAHASAPIQIFSAKSAIEVSWLPSSIGGPSHEAATQFISSIWILLFVGFLA